MVLFRYQSDCICHDGLVLSLPFSLSTICLHLSHMNYIYAPPLQKSLGQYQSIRNHCIVGMFSALLNLWSILVSNRVSVTGSPQTLPPPSYILSVRWM